MSGLFYSALLNVGFFIGNFNTLWVAGLAIGIVIIVGFMMVAKRKRREPVPASYKMVHIAATAIGAVIALVAALMGDTRLWTNIILAVIIVALGAYMALGKLTKSSAKTILLLHAGIGITCYVIFVYYIVTY